MCKNAEHSAMEAKISSESTNKALPNIYMEIEMLKKFKLNTSE